MKKFTSLEREQKLNLFILNKLRYCVNFLHLNFHKIAISLSLFDLRLWLIWRPALRIFWILIFPHVSTTKTTSKVHINLIRRLTVSSKYNVSKFHFAIKQKIQIGKKIYSTKLKKKQKTNNVDVHGNISEK